MADTTDQLDIQKSTYLTEIRELEERIARLKTKVEVIEDIRRDSKQPSVLRHNGTAVIRTGLTKLTMEAVRKVDEGTLGKIGEYVLSNGYQPKKNFKTSLGTTLARLMERGKLTVETRDGNRIYKAK